MVQVYLKDEKAKRGVWSSPGIILSLNQEAGFVVVPGRSRKRIDLAFEDTRAVQDGCNLYNLVRSAIDELDEYVSELLEVFAECATPPSDVPENIVESAEGVFDFSSEPPVRPDTGDRVEVFWPDGNQYYAGAVTKVCDDGEFVAVYEHDGKEVLNMSDEN